jgi:hypothetical protein
MSSPTRIVRGFHLEGPEQRSIGTMMFGAEPPPVADTREMYARLHHVIRHACLEETRPGVFVFAVEQGGVPRGRLWLSATVEPRAGTLGRHEAVDLPIGSDAALSLRHLVVVVRLVNGRVRTSLLDLETPSGLHTPSGAQHLTETDGPALLKTSRLALFCVPTGPGQAPPTDAAAAFRLFERTPVPQGTSLFRKLLGSARRAGMLTLRYRNSSLPLTVDDEMLARGVLIGRADRCDVLVPDRFVSRVHAVALNIDGVPYVVNTASSNGLWHQSGEQAKCWKLSDGDTFHLGSATLQWKDLR